MGRRGPTEEDSTHLIKQTQLSNEKCLMYDYDGSSERKQAPRNPHAARQARDLCARIDSVGLYQLWLYQDGQMNQTIHRQSQSAESPTGKRSYSWSAFGTVTQSLVHLSKLKQPEHVHD